MTNLQWTVVQTASSQRPNVATAGSASLRPLSHASLPSFCGCGPLPRRDEGRRPVLSTKVYLNCRLVSSSTNTSRKLVLCLLTSATGDCPPDGQVFIPLPTCNHVLSGRVVESVVGGEGSAAKTAAEYKRRVKGIILLVFHCLLNVAQSAFLLHRRNPSPVLPCSF